MLKQLFQKACCCHDWEERYKTRVFETDSSSRPYEIKVTLVCKKCGKIKQINLL